jgi:type VI protein secretion system component VasK
VEDCTLSASLLLLILSLSQPLSSGLSAFQESSMATTMNAGADGAVAVPAVNLLEALLTAGGTQGATSGSSNPGDITALQQVLAQLQGADYSAMLQSIFQRAGQQIPSLMGAYTSAVGARSSKNSAVEQALAKLLQETTLLGQDQLAKQQLQNQQVQTNAGTSIAQATKGTQTSQKTEQGLNIGNTAKMLAIAQLLAKTGLLKGVTGATTGAPAVAAPAAPSIADMLNFNLAAPAMSSNITGMPDILGFTPDSSTLAPSTVAAPQTSGAQQPSMMDSLQVDFNQLFSPSTLNTTGGGGQPLVGGFDFGAPSLDNLTLDTADFQDWFSEFGG